MYGLMITKQEYQEIEYLLRREMEEITLDLGDNRIDPSIKNAMEKRYEVLFHLFRRFASGEECLHYMPKRKKQN
ncbi:hypothetical protein [Halobacillus massiliensis]|uniref:hypothetical protein n=1 Tax=Halobacillus massiliensis TaxID=1926286 RepID=UPI0009E33797|nr:hypothetical protein [Halobacillus massiliensis]